MFNRSNLVPGELPYTNTVKSARLHSGNHNRITIFVDSIFRGTSVRDFKNETKSGCAKFKTFPGSDFSEILHSVNPSLENGN